MESKALKDITLKDAQYGASFGVDNFNIEMKLDKDFVAMLKYLIQTFGDKIARMNGFSNSSLNFTDFIDNFIDTNVVADAVLDSTANNTSKDICTLTQDMNGPHMKLLSYNKIFYEIKKKYGLEEAQMWLLNDWTGANYLHNSKTASFLPYCYKGSETVLAKYKESNPLLISFTDLFDLVQEDSFILDEDLGVICKNAKDLEVWDNGVWVNVPRVMKRPKHTNFHFIEASNGLSTIVTGDHPIITLNRGDIPAREVQPGVDVLRTEAPSAEFGNITDVYITNELLPKGYNLRFNNYSADTSSFNQEGVVQLNNGIGIPNHIALNRDFGWLLGIIMSDASFNTHEVIISQNEGEIFDEIIRILDDLYIPYNVYYHDRYTRHGGNPIYRIHVNSTIFANFLYEVFIIPDTQYTRRFKPTILNYNKEFIKGIIAGMLDGDGTLGGTTGRRIHFRITSRHLLMQLGYMMRMLGFQTREQTPSIYQPRIIEWGVIAQNRYVYHLAAMPYTDDKEQLDSIKFRTIKDSLLPAAYSQKMANKKYTFEYGDCNIIMNQPLIDAYEPDEWVYDITTETGHFTCNGIISHNCYAYDLDQLAEKGLFFINSFKTTAPKHLTTFNDHVLEFIGWATNRSSGAVGLPSYLVYSWYFWYKDVQNGFYLKDPEYYRRQCFQKFV